MRTGDGTEAQRFCTYAGGMAGHGIIDLDQRDGDPGESNESRRGRGRFGRRLAMYLVGSFALGMALGGVGVAHIQDRREQRVQSGTVAVVAVAGPTTSSGENRNGNARLDAQLAVINMGPAPVTIRFVGAQDAGVLVRDLGQSLSLDAGGTGGIDVQLTVECRLARPNPLPMRFSVKTADQRTREVSYTVAVEKSAWHYRVDTLCNGSVTGAR